MLGIFLDTETNGLNFYKHRLLEIALKIVDLSNGQLIDTYESIVSQPEEIWKESDKVSLSVNGFRWEQVQQGLPEETVAQAIIHCFESHKIKRGKAVYICQNPSFDRIFFSQLIPPEVQEKKQWPYHWLDLASMHWSLAIQNHRNKQGALPWDIGISKDRIANYYKIPPEERPHKAINGVDHLITCYEKIVGYLI